MKKLKALDDTRIGEKVELWRSDSGVRVALARKPGFCRVNLGCIEGLDSSDFEVTLFDGKNLL